MAYRIEEVLIVSRGNANEVQECVRSYASAARRERRLLRITVVDDGPPEDQRRVETALARTWPGVDVRHFGRAEKEAFVRALGFDEVTMSQFFPSACGTTRVGANRNFALLLSAGRRVLLVDSDTRAEIVDCADGTESRVMEGDPWDYLGFDSVSQAIEEAHFDSAGELSVFEVHEAWLGRRIDDLSLVRNRTKLAGGRIVLSMLGFAGEDGMTSRGHLIHSDSGDLFGEDEHDYVLRRLSRGAWTAVSMPTVARTGRVVAGSTGLDASSVLPPFMPVGRNQLSVFGHMLNVLDPNALRVALPGMVQHGSRRSAERTEIELFDVASPRWHEHVRAVVERVEVEHPREVTLRRLACGFREAAELTAGDWRRRFVEPVHELLSGAASHLRAVAARERRRPTRARDLATIAGVLEATVRSGAACVDLPDDVDGLRRRQAAFGHLLSVWNEVWTAARAASPSEQVTVNREIDSSAHS